MTAQLKAVVFDWAGTIVDFGSRAPMGAFVEVFARLRRRHLDRRGARADGHGEAAAHRGADDAAAHRRRAWEKAHGHGARTRPISTRVYEVFVPLNAKVVADYATLIPGRARDGRPRCARRGLKIGSTTGYTREIMAPLLPVAAAQGYEPDNLVCAGDLAEGRPSPLMMYRSFADLGV